MSTQTEIPKSEPLIIMTRVYDAPRARVWEAMTEPRHVSRWWGGPGFTNPVCETDLRPGGRWHHVMRFPDGHELVLDFVFLEVDPPSRLAWQHVDHGKRKGLPPTCMTTSTLEEINGRTHATMVARFNSFEDREAALDIGFTGPIAASNDRLVEYLKTMKSDAGVPR
jgi:uncharacterized protein YndB with AHSA1/START domain